MHTPTEEQPDPPSKLTFREELVIECTRKAHELNRKLTSLEIVDAACSIHEKLKFDFTPAQPAEKKKRKIEMADEDWICSLEADPTYRGLDVRREIGKCQAWANTRPGVLVTRRRVIAWLNKAERPIGYDGTGQSSIGRKPQAIGIPEPSGWLMWLAENRPDCVYCDGRPWATIDPVGQKYIIDQMKTQ
jgi:hypothetical protein